MKSTTGETVKNANNEFLKGGKKDKKMKKAEKKIKKNLKATQERYAVDDQQQDKAADKAAKQEARAAKKLAKYNEHADKVTQRITEVDNRLNLMRQHAPELLKDFDKALKDVLSEFKVKVPKAKKEAN